MQEGRSTIDLAAVYKRRSLEGAAICQEAHQRATQKYDHELEPHSKAMSAAWGTPHYNQACKNYNEALFTLDKRRDKAYQKADKIYAALMKDAWEEAFQSKPAETKQMGLWSEVQA